MQGTEWTYIIGHVICIIGFVVGGVYMLMPRLRSAEVVNQGSLSRIAGVNMLFWAMSHFMTILLTVMLGDELEQSFANSLSMVIDLLVVPGVVYVVMSLMSCKKNLWWIVCIQIIPALCILAAYWVTREYSYVKISACYWTAYVCFFLLLFAVLEYSFRYYHLDLTNMERDELNRLHMLLCIFTVYFVLYGVSMLVSVIWLSVLVALSELVVWAAVVRHIETMQVQVDFWEIDGLDAYAMRELLKAKAGADESLQEETKVEAVQPEKEAESTGADKFSWIGELLQKECVDKQLYLRSDLTIDMLARQLKTNRTYLNNYLSNRGMSYYDFVNLHRIAHAKRLIDEGENNMSVVASESGYGSDSTFRRAFQDQVGCLPSQYLRQVRGPKKKEVVERKR